MKFPNIEIRKTLSLVAMVALVAALGWALFKGEKDIAIMIIGALISCVTWYFAKSTALDKPQQ